MVILPPARSLAVEAQERLSGLERILGMLSALSMLMTVPQVVKIWSAHNAGGVSLLSWMAYLFTACIWLIHGLRKRDKSIYVACIGWILLDAAVVAGILAFP